MTFASKFGYMANHFILLQLNAFGLRLDKEEWWFEHSVSQLRLFCQQKFLKMFAGTGYLLLKDAVIWIGHLLVNFYIWLTISSCLSSIPLALGLIKKNGGLRILCHSRSFDYRQRMVKILFGPGDLLSKDAVVWPWHLLVNLYIWLTYFTLLRLNPFGLKVDWKG